jgi:catechol-2,3-dioxygenase
MRDLALAVCFVAALASPAAAEPRETPFKAVSGAFFAVSVPSLGESVRWYSEKLGLSITMEAPGSPAVTVLEGSGLVVELIQDPAARPASVQQHGMFKGGFMVKHFETTLGNLQKRGVAFAFGPYPATDKQRANVIILDNNGNLIQIFGE